MTARQRLAEWSGGLVALTAFAALCWFALIAADRQAEIQEVRQENVSD